MSEDAAGTPSIAPEKRVPRRRISDLQQWWLVTAHQLSHYLRTHRFYGLLGFVVLISALSLGLQLYAGVAAVRVQQLYRPTEYLSNYLANTGLFVVLSAAFFGGDALSVDFSTGAGYYMLVLPIRRPVLLAGRYAAATLVTLATIGVYYAFAVFGAAYFFGLTHLPWEILGISLGVAAVFTLASVSFAFCVSAFVRSPAAGVLITVLALYVGFSTLQATLELANVEPWFSLSYAGGSIVAVLDSDFLHYQTIPLGQDQHYTIWSSTVGEGLAIMAGYLAVLLPLSAFLYQRKESTG